MRAGDLKNEAGFYGLLLSAGKRVAPKTVCDETALVFFTLSQPGPVPSYLINRLGTEADAAIAELVLDGIVEYAPGPDGPFVSGAAASDAIGAAAESVSPSAGILSTLADRALRYGAMLRTLSVAELSMRLYSYNTECLTRERRLQLAQTRGVLDFLGAGRWFRAALRAAGWRGAPDDGSSWIYFSGPDARIASYKLYVSPRFDLLPDSFEAIARTVIDSRAIAFKLGADLPGLLRPDRIVVYCHSFEDLAALADALQQALGDCPARGVPFTAGIDEAGLLSWGMDPPPDRRPAEMDQSESWRSWLTSRLAASLADAGDSSSVDGAVKFACERLSLAGVDTQNWTPNQAIWLQA